MHIIYQDKQIKSNRNKVDEMSITRMKGSVSKKYSTSTKSRSLINENDDYFEAIYLSVFRNLDEEISTADELMLLLQHAGCNPSKKTISKYWDENAESYSFSQFCSILKQEEKCSRDDLLKAFKKIDRNGDGYISHEELIQMLTKHGERMTKAEVNSMIEDGDYNGDGKLDYEEFCSMMDDITAECQQLHISKGSKSPRVKSVRASESVSTNSLLTGENSFRERRNLSKSREQRQSCISNSKLKKSSRGSIISQLSKQESMRGMKNKDGPKAKIDKIEPKDLSLWQFHSSKGCFYKEEDGSIVSHQFQLKVTQPTSLWITINAVTPKYGKFNDEILESDLMIFLMEDTAGKMISFSDVDLDGKVGLLADVDIGVYNILTFTSGIKLCNEESESGKVSLVKGTGEEARLTKSCKDCIMEIFYRSDLDGNGYLNRKEFNEFQKRTSGEECNDETWEIVKGTVDLTPQLEITLKGFIELNLLEVRDPDGGQDELWITLESSGYSKKLILNKACPFSLEVYTRKGKNELSLVGVTDGGDEIQEAIVESIKMVSTAKPMKNKQDLDIHVANFGKRYSIAVNNRSRNPVLARIDCSGSENLISNQGSLDVAEEVDSKSMMVMHHLVPMDSDQSTWLKFQESVEHSRTIWR